MVSALMVPAGGVQTASSLLQDNVLMRIVKNKITLILITNGFMRTKVERWFFLICRKKFDYHNI